MHIVPGLGAHKIDRVEPEHLERFYRMKQQSGRVALGEAVRRGHVATNVAEIAKAPRLEGEDIEPFTIERFRACSWGRPSCATGPAGWSPWRSAFGTEKRLVAGGPATARTASRSGVSTRAPSLVPDGARSGCLIRSSSFCASTRRSRSRRERAVAVAPWAGKGYVFASPLGGPLNPNTDFHVWKRLLRDAGVRDGRLHDARHSPREPGCALGTCTSLGRCCGRSRSRLGMRFRSRHRQPQKPTETDNGEGPHRKGWGPSTSCPVRHWRRIRDSNS